MVSGQPRPLPCSSCCTYWVTASLCEAAAYIRLVRFCQTAALQRLPLRVHVSFSVHRIRMRAGAGLYGGGTAPGAHSAPGGAARQPPPRPARAEVRQMALSPYPGVTCGPTLLEALPADWRWRSSGCPAAPPGFGEGRVGLRCGCSGRHHRRRAPPQGLGLRLGSRRKRRRSPWQTGGTSARPRDGLH